jgi:hypothetical protein
MCIIKTRSRYIDSNPPNAGLFRIPNALVDDYKPHMGGRIFIRFIDLYF